MHENTQLGTEQCRRAWRIFSTLRKRYIASALSVVPGSLIVGMAFERYGVLPFIGWLLMSISVFLYLGKQLSQWRCPRCRAQFLTRKNPFAQRCTHCALEVRSCEFLMDSSTKLSTRP